MTYELAKQLKNEGYPQKTWENSEDYNITIEVPNSESVYVPSLLELIEALGEEFNFLCRNPDTGKWGAESFRGDVITNLFTPEEAVANLWLALNGQYGNKK